jgi:ketosteroid isomerase-like protein
MPGSVNVTLSPACRRCLHAGWTMAAALALAASTIPVCAGMGIVQKHESRHEIDQLEDEWRDAVLTANIKELDSLLAEDYISITPSGTLQTKEETLESLRTGRLHFTTLVLTDRKVRFYGSTAVVISLAKIQAKTTEGEVEGSYRYTRVYARDPQGHWKIVSFEASRVREPGPHHRTELH